MLVVFPQSPAHPRERPKDAAIDSRQVQHCLASGPSTTMQLLRQFSQDAMQSLGVKHSCGFVNEPRDVGRFQPPLHSLQRRCLLQTPQTGIVGLKKYSKQQADVLVVKQPPVPCSVAFSAPINLSIKNGTRVKNTPAPRYPRDSKSRRRVAMMRLRRPAVAGGRIRQRNVGQTAFRVGANPRPNTIARGGQGG